MSCYCQSHDVVVQPDDYCLPDGEPLVIFGSRSYQHEPGTVSERGDRIVAELASRNLAEPGFIVSGGADGADAVAEAVAIKLGVPMVVFAVNSASDATCRRRDWATEPWTIVAPTSYSGPSHDPRSGRGAYLTRNCLMAAVVAQRDGAAFAIYDGESQGTAHMLDSCESHGVTTIEQYRYDRDDN